MSGSKMRVDVNCELNYSEICQVLVCLLQLKSIILAKCGLLDTTLSYFCVCLLVFYSPGLLRLSSEFRLCRMRLSL